MSVVVLGTVSNTRHNATKQYEMALVYLEGIVAQVRFLQTTLLDARKISPLVISVSQAFLNREEPGDLPDSLEAPDDMDIDIEPPAKEETNNAIK